MNSRCFPKVLGTDPGSDVFLRRVYISHVMVILSFLHYSSMYHRQNYSRVAVSYLWLYQLMVNLSDYSMCYNQNGSSIPSKK